MTDEILSTKEVAAQLGCTPTALLLWINRYPEYRPGKQMGKSSSWLWLPAEIEKIKRGRAAKKARTGKRGKANQDRKAKVNDAG